MHSNVSTNTNMRAVGHSSLVLQVRTYLKKIYSSSLSCVSMGVVNSAPELDMAASYNWCAFFSLTPTSCTLTLVFLVVLLFDSSALRFSYCVFLEVLKVPICISTLGFCPSVSPVSS